MDFFLLFFRKRFSNQLIVRNFAQKKLIIMKRNLLFLGFLTLASQAFTQTSNCLPDWEYRMPVTVSNANAAVLTDYQVNLTVNTQALISAGKMNLDGSDIRFAIDCCTPVCYWIESGLNTTTTSVWVNVSSIPSMGEANIFMYYGNSTATDASDAACVFDVFDDFDNDALNQFSQVCGTGSESFAGGELALSWSNDVVYQSSMTLPLGNIYTIESNITAASGSWPGIYAMKQTDSRSYGNLMGSSQMRISVGSTSVSTPCDGHNWASTQLSYTNPVGIWSLTWRGTGDIIADFPTIGAVTSTDVTFALDDALVVGFGGISGGTGSMTIDWIRARKYAAITPTFVFGTEEVPSGAQVVSITAPASGICPGESVQLDAGTGFINYDWSTTESTQTIDVSAAGWYYVTATDLAGCSSEDSVEINAFTSPIAGFGSAVAGGDVTFSNSSTDGISYAWDFGDGNSSTDENPSHTYAANATYSVCLTVTSADGCTDDICNDVIVSTVGLSGLEQLSFELYPNPTNSELNVVSPLEEDVLFELTSLDGKVVKSGKLARGVNVLNVTSTEAGSYILRLPNHPGYGSRIVVQ